MISLLSVAAKFIPLTLTKYCTPQGSPASSRPCCKVTEAGALALNEVQCGIFGRELTKQISKEDNKYTSHNGGGQNLRSTSDNGLQSNQKSKYAGSGLSAWGIIVLILLVILLGMGGYYGILCYPIVCKHERMYDIMDAGSTSSGTPTRSTEFEKMGNYSSRSTTP
ncbi:hypothetical protein Bhyg_05127, partial [Pseudolycoriella hygida]